MKQKKIQVFQNEEKPIPAEIIANSIVEIAEAMRKINSTRLTKKAIVALIHMNSKVSRTTIEIVLNNLDLLEETYLKKRPS